MNIPIIYARNYPFKENKRIPIKTPINIFWCGLCLRCKNGWIVKSSNYHLIVNIFYDHGRKRKLRYRGNYV